MILLALSLPLLPAAPQEPELRIDPLLLRQVVEVFQYIAAENNPIWPGWDASDTPVLLYLPDVQDLLLNHPSPPQGFASLQTDLLPEDWSCHVRDGETVFDLDGQNTSRVIGGVQTLVVADPISNMRPGLAQLLRDPAQAQDKIERLDLRLLSTDPYEQLAFVVHEAFHVHQYDQAEGKLANEMLLLEYPWLSAAGNVGWVLEGRALAEVMRAGDSGAVREAGLRWLAVRQERRAGLTAAASQYEDGTEFGEGLAKYTEWKLCRVLEGRRPDSALRFARGFRGYQDLGFWRERLVTGLLAATSGEMEVNGDRFGSGNLRFRLYYTGMGIAALLDGLGAEGWQERMLEPGTTLTDLAGEALAASEGELAAALVRAHDVPDHEQILRDKIELEQAGARVAAEQVQRILAGEALFTLDYSALGTPPVRFSFTPFGLTRVDEERVIYSMVPVGVGLGSDVKVRQLVPAPLLHDRGARTIQFQLRRPVDRAALLEALGLERLPEASVDLRDLKLPGATIERARGRLSTDGRGLLLELVAD